MKLVAKAEAVDIKDNPRPKDRVMWNRMMLVVEHEACHPAWGCALYRLHRLGRIDNDEREAGDRYWKVIEDHRREQATDPDELPEYARDMAYRRVAKAKKRCNEATAAIGFGRRVLDPLIFEERWPQSEKEHLIVKQCLSVLKTFFLTGKRTKRVR
jgi:hypothetical protein